MGKHRLFLFASLPSGLTPLEISERCSLFPVAIPHIPCDSYVASTQERKWAAPNSIFCKAP
jgi:hypothetical protein